MIKINVTLHHKTNKKSHSTVLCCGLKYVIWVSMSDF